MDGKGGPAELGDRWDLGLRGRKVTQIGGEFALMVVLGPGAELMLESLVLMSPAGNGPHVEVVPDRTGGDRLRHLLGVAVLSAVAFKTGGLRLALADGTRLDCGPDPDYEAWQVSGPDGWMFVALPGGGLGVWPPT